MTETLFDIVYQVYRHLGIMSVGVATGGSATTIVDTNDRTEADDYWNGGTGLIIGAGSAAPEGEFSVISDFDNATGTITLRSTLTATVESGDRYGAAKSRYPLELVKQYVNSALRDFGLIETTDKTTLDTASAKTEYTLPIAASLDLRQVFVQTNTNDTNDYRWSEVHGWRIERTGTGTQDLLIVPYQPIASRDIKLVYMDLHTELFNASDKVNEVVHPDRLIYQTVYDCLLYRYQKLGYAEPSISDQIQEYRQRALEAKVKYPNITPPARSTGILPENGIGGRTDHRGIPIT